MVENASKLIAFGPTYERPWPEFDRDHGIDSYVNSVEAPYKIWLDLAVQAPDGLLKSLLDLTANCKLTDQELGELDEVLNRANHLIEAAHICWVGHWLDDLYDTSTQIAIKNRCDLRKWCDLHYWTLKCHGLHLEERSYPKWQEPPSTAKPISSKFLQFAQYPFLVERSRLRRLPSGDPIGTIRFALPLLCSLPNSNSESLKKADSQMMETATQNPALTKLQLLGSPTWQSKWCEWFETYDPKKVPMPKLRNLAEISCDYMRSIGGPWRPLEPIALRSIREARRHLDLVARWCEREELGPVSPKKQLGKILNKNSEEGTSPKSPPDTRVPNKGLPGRQPKYHQPAIDYAFKLDQKVPRPPFKDILHALKKKYNKDRFCIPENVKKLGDAIRRRRLQPKKNSAK